MWTVKIGNKGEIKEKTKGHVQLLKKEEREDRELSQEKRKKRKERKGKRKKKKREKRRGFCTTGPCQVDSTLYYNAR